MPSYVLNDELPATATPSTQPVAPKNRKIKLYVATLLCAGAALFSLSACGPTGSGAGSQAVAIASEKAGDPYVYGAAGPDSFDCSGFTQYVYGQLGISLPHSATEQGNDVTLIPSSEAQPGDLVFFGTPGNFYHVGIYAGNGELWYAPKTGDVVKEGPIWDSAVYYGRA